MLMEVYEVVDLSKKFTSDCKDKNEGRCYDIEKSLINTDYILKVESDHSMLDNFKKQYFKREVYEKNYRVDAFTRIILVDGSNKMIITVIGTPDKLFNNRQVING